MESYKVRVTLKNNLDEVINYIDSIAEQYCWVKEGSEHIKDHVHLWILTSLKKTQLRYQIGKRFGKGNEWFSVSECKETYPFEYWNYMQKVFKVVFIRIPQEVLLEFQEFMKSYKEKKTKQKDVKVWEEIMLIVIEKYSDNVGVFNSAEFDKDLLEIILEYHKDKKTVISKNRIFTYLDTIKINLPVEIYPERYLWNDLKKRWLEQYNGKLYSNLQYHN